MGNNESQEAHHHNTTVHQSQHGDLLDLPTVSLASLKRNTEKYAEETVRSRLICKSHF